MTEMATDNLGFREDDPLEGCYGLCLFPKTFDVSSDVSNPYDFDHELQFINNHLKSMVCRSPNKLREQAKSILDESSKTGNSTIMWDQGTVVNNEVPPIMERGNARERRPGLGRKQARFSLNPKYSQPVLSSEPTFNPKDFTKPEEFFKAYEQHEIAKREMQRLKGGVLLDSKQQNTFLNKRPRRPGMLGDRRSVKYRHLYPSDDSKTINNALSSQENFNSSIPSPDYHTSQESDHDFTSQGKGLAGSLSKGEPEVDEILDQLLSYNYEDLDDDQVFSVIQERLQIKKIELKELNLPNFHDIPKIDLKSAKSKKHPKRSHTLSNVDNLLEGFGLSIITPMKHKHGSESSVHLVDSPTPPKSPFSSFSLLNQRILRSSSSKDPFSCDDIDVELVTNPSQPMNEELSDVGRQSDTECPLFEKDDAIEVSKTHTSKVDGVLDMGTSASHLPSADDMTDSNTDDVVMNDKLAVHDTDGELVTNPSQPINKEFSDVGRQSDIESPLFEKDDAIEVSKTHTSKVEEVLDVGTSASHLPRADDTTDSNTEVMNGKLAVHDNDGNAQANENNVQDEVEETSQETLVPAQSSLNTVDPSLDNGSKEQTEIVEEHFDIPLDKKRKAASHLQKAPKRGGLDRRKSLAGAGTMWESGVRRSTRIKSRPLEYWNGERFLYGRIHNSLPTVIGLKYASPSAKGDMKTGLKVKSFVSDEHKELVELAALH